MAKVSLKRKMLNGESYEAPIIPHDTQNKMLEQFHRGSGMPKGSKVKDLDIQEPFRKKHRYFFSG
jgi:hypothetical protein